MKLKFRLENGDKDKGLKYNVEIKDRVVLAAVGIASCGLILCELIRAASKRH